MEIRAYPSELRLLERAESEVTGIGILHGYIARFRSDSLDMGGYKEQIRQGAFRESLKSNDVVALVNHNRDAVVGRLSSGTLRLAEDDMGLSFSLDIPDTEDGRRLKTLTNRKDMIGCSFGFLIDAGDLTWSQRDGEDLCVLERVNLQEVSVGVTFPAYPETSMVVRTAFHARQKRARDKASLDLLMLKHR